MIKKILILLTCSIIINSCSKDQEFNELRFENMEGVSAVLNQEVLLVHNSKLNNSNSTGGMEYDPVTGQIIITRESAEEVGYEFREGLIMSVDMDTSAILRKIVTVETIGEEIHIQTGDADLEEIFRDAEFELASEFDEDVNLKSTATDEEIWDKMVRGNKILPARIIHHTEDGIYVQSVFEGENIKNTSNLKGESTKTISFNYNLAGKTIYESTSNNKHLKLSVESGSIDMGTSFVLATSIRWGKLKAFRFQVKPYANFDMKANLYASASTGTISGSKKIKDNAYKKTFIYYLGGILVVSVTIDVDIYAGYNFSASSSLSVTSGFYAGVYADIGARWEKGKWSPIKVFGHLEGAYPVTYSAVGTSDLRLELYPKATALIYGIEGVSMDVVPYFSNNITATSVNGVNSVSSNVKFGLDTRVNAKVKIVKKNLASYSSGNIAILPAKTIWSKTW